MDVFCDNLPDRVWNSLKTWALIQRDLDGFPTLDESAAQVRHFVAAHTGRPTGLPDAVVDFYAGETLEMIRKHRAERDADDRIGDTNLEPAI